MSEPLGDSYENILLARNLLRQDQLGAYGLNTSPEQVLKALQRHPDGLPQPHLMRWSEQPTLRPQDHYLSLLAPDDLRAHEMRWIVLEELGKQEASDERTEQIELVDRAAQALAKVYPDNPVPTQQRLQCLRLLQDTEGLFALAQELFDAHPDYLFARLSLAEVLQFRGRIKDVAALFESRCELQDYEGERMFHHTEVAGFYSIAGMVHLHLDRPLRALWALALMRSALPDFIPIQRLEDALLALPEAKLKELGEQLKGQRKLNKLGRRKL